MMLGPGGEPEFRNAFKADTSPGLGMGRQTTELALITLRFKLVWRVDTSVLHQALPFVNVFLSCSCLDGCWRK
jgi:hypothetical protein